MEHDYYIIKVIIVPPKCSFMIGGFLVYFLVYSYFDDKDDLIKSFYFNESKKEVKCFLDYLLNNLSESACFQYYFCKAKILKDGFHVEE